MKRKKRLIIIGVFLVLVLSFFLYDKFLSETGTTINIQQAQVKIVPLSQAQVEKVASILLTSEFIKDVPEKNPIALQFYDFKDGERIWQSGFLIGGGRLLASGDPSVYVIIHSKYISKLNENNFCEIIMEANRNGDLGFHSEYSKASLAIKYSGMLRHKSCLGF